MARIRTIKPEFWTSAQVVECSTSARLLFIGLWNFCDDQGVHPAKPKEIKMKIFPGDSFTVEEILGWLQELITNGLLREFESGNSRYYYVTGWNHQKIDRPVSKYPEPKFDEDSSSDRRGLVEDSPPEGNGKEGNGKEWNGKECDSTKNFVEVLDKEYSCHPVWEVFRKWLDYKKHKRQSYKTRESTLTSFNKLIDFSNNDYAKAEQIIEHSISNNYDGFFKPTEYHPRQKPAPIRPSLEDMVAIAESV